MRRRVLELRQDRIARVAPHADDERKAELRLVGIVQTMEAREVGLTQRIEADARLLALRLLGDRTGAGGLAGKVGMATQELELTLARRRPDRAHHRFVQQCHARKRARGPRRLGDPWSQFEGLADRARKGR
jgi:hypothetical protein